MFDIDGHKGLAAQVLGYRIHQPCDGAVVAASPFAAPPAPDPARAGSARVKRGLARHGTTSSLTRVAGRARAISWLAPKSVDDHGFTKKQCGARNR